MDVSVVFLDIDGVLNTPDSYNHLAQSNTIRPEPLQHLQWLLRESPDAKIVVISAWRYMVSNGAMSPLGFEYLLRTHQIPKGKLIGFTVVDEVIPLRSDQIIHWRRTHLHEGPYVILDNLDLYTDTPVFSHFVHVDEKFGMTHQDARRVFQILQEAKP